MHYFLIRTSTKPQKNRLFFIYKEFGSEVFKILLLKIPISVSVLQFLDKKRF